MYRDFSPTRLHLALLCICDTRALDAVDRGALTVHVDKLFMVIIASCLYNMHCMYEWLVLYAWCYGLCTRSAARDDIIWCHDRLSSCSSEGSRPWGVAVTAPRGRCSKWTPGVLFTAQDLSHTWPFTWRNLWLRLYWWCE
jgi:hypothetical protein